MLLDFFKNLLGIGVKKITVEELNGKKIPVIDIREKNKYDEEHIPGAINIPFREFDINNPKIKEVNKNREIAVCCVSGISSIKIARILNENGYGKAKSLKGGFVAWKAFKNSKNN
jgi:rhodanese-related sulfurtransferase